MTAVYCNRRKCLNNRGGKCTAESIVYEGRCETYSTFYSMSKNKGGKCHKVHGKFKADSVKVFK